MCNMMHSCGMCGLHVCDGTHLQWLNFVGKTIAQALILHTACTQFEPQVLRIHLFRHVDVNRSYVWRDFFICVTWRIHTDCTQLKPQILWIYPFHVCRDSFIRVTRHLHIYDVTFWSSTHLEPQMLQISPLHVQHDSFICMTWPVHTCDVTHWSRVQLQLQDTAHLPVICVCDMT